MAFADFWPVPGSEVGARNGQERVECGPERAESLTCVVRRNPQERAGTGAIRQEKTPTENGWGFIIGGAKETALVVFCRYILTTTDVIQHHGSMETSHQTILDLAAQRGLIRPRGTVMLTFSGRKKSITLNLKLHFAHTHHATRQSDVPSPRGNEQL